jgi:hypothetical protein
MFGHSLERLTVRLWLLAAILMGASPRQGLVLCVGPEGTYSLEVALDEARCGGCPEVSEPVQSQDGGAVLGDSADCPCSDYPVITGSGEARSKPRPVDVDMGHLARLPVPFAASIEAHHAHAAPAAVQVGPNIDPRLTALRTVVLRV